ncbi:MAG: 4-(cytidine 5'-diphospho)-2-C-methyl-D-erythritol kinase, partial [Odoribacter sp.]|nr:4-(cytidine 5'-diphospho)-2-C-methyl-D-erythritol kinase [Odoribacter sp.]
MILFPNAKLNIGLFVTGKRPDGFHDLETVFYPLELCDILEVLPLVGSTEQGKCCFEGSGIDLGCAPEKNLVMKAYRLLDKEFGLPSVTVHLHKVVPFGAGLGGGSSDAAFMLRGLNELFRLGLTEEELTDRASELGSDCAFFIGNRPAFASGRGERLEKIGLSMSGYWIVLVKPDFGISTAEAYAGICPVEAACDLRRLEELPLEQWKGVVANDFEKSLFPKYPRLAELKQYLYDKGA